MVSRDNQTASKALHPGLGGKYRQCNRGSVGDLHPVPCSRSQPFVDNLSLQRIQRAGHQQHRNPNRSKRPRSHRTHFSLLYEGCAQFALLRIALRQQAIFSHIRNPIRVNPTTSARIEMEYYITGGKVTMLVEITCWETRRKQSASTAMHRLQRQSSFTV